MKKIPLPVAATTTAAVTVLALAGTRIAPAGAAQSTAPAAGDAVTHQDNERVPKGAAWTQHYFPSSDGSGTDLHADVLLPEDLPPSKKVPVILSVGSYFGHSGELTDEKWKKTGPSGRFKDLVEGGDLFERDYALVQVDLRGFGGSSGCLDYMGKGEQADVKAAIDWAAKQPWSTGKVQPVERDVRVTGTPGVRMDTEGSGNVMVKLYDAAPDGSAVMFDQQVAMVDASGRVAVDLKSTDWRLKAGHSLAIEIGTVQDGAWIDTPTGDRIKVSDAHLNLSVDDPADDKATEGERSPYLDTYLKMFTTKELPTQAPSFTVPAARD
ncbi:CocE/NonD family hydrolase [Streptomyces sp. UC4497]